MMKSVLFADNNPDIRLLVHFIIHKYQPDTKVTTVVDGCEAVKLVDRCQYDFIILDNRMPPGKFGGIWAAQEIHQRYPTLPIVFLSTYTQPPQIKAAYEAGALFYIGKEASLQPEVMSALAAGDWPRLKSFVGAQPIWYFEIRETASA
jgi:CheY-like chemotaxis protein